MNIVRIAALGALGLFLILPVDLAAQGRARGHDKQDKQDKQEERHDKQEEREARKDRQDEDRAERMETARVDAREVRRDRREADRPRTAPVTERIVIRDGTGRLLYRDRGREILLLERDVDERFRVRDSNGPAFCRSGSGHPVHGRAWCLEKGFGLGQADEFFFDGDDTVYYHDGDEVVVVRDSRLDRDRSVWERVVDVVVFWRD